MATTNDGYFKRSWALLTRENGWIKPVLVMAAATLIPIVGNFGTNGYALEWARLTAWGVDSSPKQKNVNVGACIKTGAMAFVVSLGYMVALFVLQAAMSTLFGETLGGLVSFALTIAVTLFLHVAELRATIYQNIVAGYEIPRIADMVQRDWKGLLRIGGMYVLYVLALSMIVGIVVTGIIIASFGSIMTLAQGYYDEAEIVRATFSALAAAMPFLFVSIYALGVVGNLFNLIMFTSVGLWMRQFDVQHWGESSDPLPSTAPQATASTAQPASSPTEYPYAGTPAPSVDPFAQPPVADATPYGSSQVPVQTDQQIVWASAPENVDAPEVRETPLITPPPRFDMIEGSSSDVAATATTPTVEPSSDHAAASDTVSYDALPIEVVDDLPVETVAEAPVQMFSLSDELPASSPAMPQDEVAGSQEPVVEAWTAPMLDTTLEEAPVQSQVDEEPAAAVAAQPELFSLDTTPAVPEIPTDQSGESVSDDQADVVPGADVPSDADADELPTEE